MRSSVNDTQILVYGPLEDTRSTTAILYAMEIAQSRSIFIRSFIFRRSGIFGCRCELTRVRQWRRGDHSTFTIYLDLSLPHTYYPNILRSNAILLFVFPIYILHVVTLIKVFERETKWWESRIFKGVCRVQCLVLLYARYKHTDSIEWFAIGRQNITKSKK